MRTKGSHFVVVLDGLEGSVAWHAKRTSKNRHQIYYRIKEELGDSLSKIGTAYVKPPKEKKVKKVKRVSSIIPVPRQCLECGSAFDSKYGALICSVKCRDARGARFRRLRPGKGPVPRIAIACKCCSKVFTPRRNNASFCGERCRKKSGRDRARVPRKEALCAKCSSLFTTLNINHRFCSARCGKKVYIRKGRLIKPKPVKILWSPFTDEPLDCGHCRLPVSLPRHKESKYCSKKCSRSAQKRRDWEKTKATPQRWIRQSLSGRLNECIKKRGAVKDNSILQYLGCSPQELVLKIEFLFTEGMSWENYGVFGWHIDHIIPCARFDLLRQDHRLVCFHWMNLQPKWAIENSYKRDKLEAGISEALKDKALSVGILVL